jgi:Tol biopolymer transport system component
VVRRTIVLLISVATAVLLAGGVASVAVEDEAQAAFPRGNGDIVFSQNSPPSSEEAGASIMRMKPDGTSVRSIYNASGFSSEPDWSADGTKIAFIKLGPNEQGFNLWVMDANGSGATALSTDDIPEESPAWFPSGNKLAFGRTTGVTSGMGSNFDLYVRTLDTAGNVTGTTQFTSDASYDSQPAVSPDGTKIAFVSTRDGDDEIYVMRADKPEGPDNRPVKLTNNTANRDLRPDWSPDGTKITFMRWYPSTRSSDIWVMNANGSGKRNLSINTQAYEQEPVFSPNGRLIAYSSNPDGDFDIWRMRADGTGRSKLTNNTLFDANPNWQPLP